jgi:thiamine phosphate synthase YjbQ (UPF0047 family)
MFSEMQTHRRECTFTTPDVLEFVDVTDEVVEAVLSSHIDHGHVTVTVPAGCSIIANEFESGLLADLKRTMHRLKSSSNGTQPTIGSGSIVLPAHEGRLRLGRWQRLLLVELERPSRRSIDVQVVGE